MTAIQQMRLGGATTAGLPSNNNMQQYRDVETQPLPEYMQQQQINGVIYTPATTVDGDHAERMADSEKLPSYDDSIAGDQSTARNIPTDNKQAAETTRAFEVPQFSQPTNAGAQGELAVGLTQFQSALASYKNGACGGRRQAKRAAKNLVYDMYAAEVARRRAEKEYLECGERKQIKRDLKPVKQMLKSAVWEAKRERSSCC